MEIRQEIKRRAADIEARITSMERIRYWQHLLVSFPTLK